ncbi:MAG: hypothetical protein KC464_05295 [Myxococcales bacterium]|nr:hypothetical protein [Myxococcales bacterium]
MTSPTERLRALAGQRRRIEIPELGDDAGPLVAYARQVSTQQAFEALQAIRAKNDDDPRIWARLVWENLEDEGGARIYRDLDWPKFSRLIPEAIARRVGMLMWNQGRIDAETAAGN